MPRLQPNEDLFENTRMSFGEHLEELRKVLIKCLISVAIGCVFGLLLANHVIRLLNGPLVRAMAKYAEVNAIDEIVAERGFVDPDLMPWIEKEKYIPRRTYVDPVALVESLKTVLPNLADQVTIDPYSFQAKDFLSSRLNRICKSMQDNPSQPVSPNDHRHELFQLLSSQEQSDIDRIARSDQAYESDVQIVVAIFNRLAREANLFDLPAFADQVTEPVKDWKSWFWPPPAKPLAKLKAEYENQDHNPVLARRLNRAILAQLFHPDMNEVKLDLVPIELWEQTDQRPQSLGAAEPFMVWMKTGIITGLTFAAPFVFYHLWSFVAAGLYPHEQHYVRIYLPISIGLFIAGAMLAFVFVFDPVLDFLFSFNRQMGIVPQMRINDWLGFVLFLPLGFGISFQLPLVMLFANRIGLVQVSTYISKWRVAIMTIFVVSVVLTPQDPISLLLMAIPLCFLYFIGVAMCVWMPKPKNPFGEEERQYTSA